MAHLEREGHRTWGYQPGWQPQVTMARLGKGAGDDIYSINFLREGVSLGFSRGTELGVPEGRGLW